MSEISILDLESISRPQEEIMTSLPPWDEAEARTRLPKTHKKPETVNAWIEEDRANHGKEILEKAALLPEYNQIVILGCYFGGKVDQWHVGMKDDIQGEFSELDVIETAVCLIRDAVRHGHLIGWNISWDIKNIIRKAWMLGIDVPLDVYNPLNRYPLSDRVVDMMLRFNAGDFKAPFTSLNNALKAVGLAGKPDGSEFAKLWSTDKAAALEYNKQELLGQAQLYRRMGVSL